MYTYTVHSCTAETTTTLQSNYPPTEKKEDFSSSPKKGSHLFLFVPLVFNHTSIRRKRPQKTFSLETQSSDGLQHRLPLHCLFS